MAGRNRMPRHPMHDAPLVFRDGPRPPPRGHGPVPLQRLEEEIAAQESDIRRLLADNRHLADEIVGRKRELTALNEERHALSQTIPKLRADKESLAREHKQKCLKLEAELRALEPLKSEAAQLKSEAKKLDAQCQELSSKAQSLSHDLKRLQFENQEIPIMKVDLDGLRQEVMLAWTACEHERKAHTELLEQRQLMESNLVTMARDIEKLRAEQRSVQPRAGTSGTGIGVGAYGNLLTSVDKGYYSSLGDGYNSEKGLYGTSVAAPYDIHGVPRR